MGRRTNQHRHAAEARQRGVDPWQYCLDRLVAAIKAEQHDAALELAIELLPYVKPKLKSVDATLTTSGKVTVVIGGDG